MRFYSRLSISGGGNSSTGLEGNQKDTKTQRKRANKGLLTRVSFVSLWLLRQERSFVELFFFGRARERRRRRSAAGNHLRDRVKIPCADKRLVLGGAISAVVFACELSLLQARISGHSLVSVLERELKHTQIERVKPG